MNDDCFLLYLRILKGEKIYFNDTSPDVEAFNILRDDFGLVELQGNDYCSQIIGLSDKGKKAKLKIINLLNTYGL